MCTCPRPSAGSAEAVRALGAKAVSGDLEDTRALTEGAEGCGLAFHAAAKVEDWGDPDEFERLNVAGTQNVLTPAAPRVQRVVHVGTEAALMAGSLWSTWTRTPRCGRTRRCSTPPRRPRPSYGSVPRTAMGSRPWWFARASCGARGDTTLLPALTELVRTGRFRWVGGGRHLTATTDVDNTVEGLWLGATGPPPVASTS